MRQSLRNLVGAGSALVDQIMAPGFDGVRETQTAWYWVKEAMDMRWESLVRALMAVTLASLVRRYPQRCKARTPRHKA